MAPRILLGVGGGIAAYKVCELLRRLRESGHAVRVIPTRAALSFVGEATWAALSGEPVATDVWAQVHEVPHVRLGREADLVVVAPATADLLARAAAGMADDLLTTTLLTAGCPIVYAPAMHTEMWLHPATQANVAKLRGWGAIVLEPAVGRLTGADSGPGRMPEPAALFEAAMSVLEAAGREEPADLAGRKVVVTAGGTREPIDPVRFLGNRSSGRQGYAFARSALARGAHVTLISANVALPAPAGVQLVQVETTEQLREATLAAANGADAVVMAAAPCDFRVTSVAEHKLKKASDGTVPTLELTTTVDIAAELGAAKITGQVLVAFAAETVGGELALRNGQAKLLAKRADLVVVNEVGNGKGFGTENNAAIVLSADGQRTPISDRSKEQLANAVWSMVVSRWRAMATTGDSDVIPDPTIT